MKVFGGKFFFSIFLIIGFSIILLILEGHTQTKRRIAVLDFSAYNTNIENAKIIRNAFEVSLYKTGAYEILERKQINVILKEQGLQMSGCTETSCAVQIGKLLSTDLVLIGSLDKFGDFTVTIKLIDIEEGKLVFADHKRAADENKILEAVNILAKITANKRYESRDKKIVAKMGEYKASKRKKVDRDLSITDRQIWTFVGYNYRKTEGEFNDFKGSGHGVSVELCVENLSINNMLFGIETGYRNITRDKSKDEVIHMVPIFITARYKINMNNLLYIAPSFSLGISYNNLKKINRFWPSDDITTKWMSISKGGVRLGYYPSNQYEIHTSVEFGNLINNKSGGVDFQMFRLGAGLRL